MNPWRSFLDQSIQRKLLWIGVVASGSALLLACGAFLAYDLLTFRKATVRQLSTHARILGANTASALLFQDAPAAVTTLSALKAEPGITRAAIFLPQGVVFAVWRRDPGDRRPLPDLPADTRESHSVGKDALALFQPLIFDGAVLGTVFIESNLDAQHARLHNYLGITGAVLFLALLAAAIVSARLGNRISEPIMALVRASRIVSAQKDYSTRVPGGGRDEVGLLISTFNEMLDRVQQGGEALRRSHELLERRVKDRTAELEAANKELEAFSYSVSHDLRAPLRSIDGFSQALLEDYADKVDEEGKDALNRVRAAAHRMGELIDDMLSLSRLTRQEMRKEVVDLSAMAREVLEELRRADPERPVDAVVGEGLTVQADAQLLRAVMENLLGNAWKFSSKNDHARIEFGAEEKEGERIFFVKDNGAGFNMEYAEKLFGVFQRLHSAADFPGTGVGLATVQRVIHRHGGRVWADSRPGLGAKFSFTILRGEP